MSFINNKLELPDDLKVKFAGYQYPGDVITMLSSPPKIAAFLVFMIKALNGYEIRFNNKDIDMMPIITYIDDKVWTQYIVLDHNFFVQTLGQYTEHFYKGTGRQLVEDFAINPEIKSNKANAIFLNYNYLQNVLGLTYINTPSNKLSVPFVKFGTPSIFENDKTTVEFTAINFHAMRLEKVVGEQIVDELIRFGYISNAVQVAFGKAATTYFADKKLKKKYFMVMDQITVFTNFQ